MGHMDTIQHSSMDKQVQRALWNTCICLCVGVGLCVCVCVCVYASMREPRSIKHTIHALVALRSSQATGIYYHVFTSRVQYNTHGYTLFIFVCVCGVLLPSQFLAVTSPVFS